MDILWGVTFNSPYPGSVETQGGPALTGGGQRVPESSQPDVPEARPLRSVDVRDEEGRGGQGWQGTRKLSGGGAGGR